MPQEEAGPDYDPRGPGQGDEGPENEVGQRQGLHAEREAEGQGKIRAALQTRFPGEFLEFNFRGNKES